MQNVIPFIPFVPLKLHHQRRNKPENVIQRKERNNKKTDFYNRKPSKKHNILTY